MSDLREGYKETEIGIIPEDWGVEKLGEVVDVRDGTHDSPKQLSEGVPLITSKNLKNGKIDLSEITYISKEDYELISKRSKVDKGDIIFAMIGTIGNPVIMDLDFEYSIKNVALLKFNKKKISNIYVKNLLDSAVIKNQFIKNNTGGVQKFVSLGQIRKTEIPTPPLKEQEKIAEILSTTDTHIEKLDKLIEDYELLKKGMMQKLLTEGIGHTEFKETEVGRIPKEWEEKKLGDIVKICYGKKQTSVESPTGKYKILGTGGIIGYANEFLYDKPSVLIGRKGTINKPMYIEEPFWTVDTLFYTDFISKTNEKWLYYVLNKIDLMKYNEATGVPSLNIKTLNSIRLSVPSYEEQHEIAVILSSIDVQIDQLKENKNYYINLKQALMDRLLTGKVRVV